MRCIDNILFPSCVTQHNIQGVGCTCEVLELFEIQELAPFGKYGYMDIKRGDLWKYTGDLDKYGSTLTFINALKWFAENDRLPKGVEVYTGWVNNRFKTFSTKGYDHVVLEYNYSNSYSLFIEMTWVAFCIYYDGFDNVVKTEAKNSVFGKHKNCKNLFETIEGRTRFITEKLMTKIRMRT